jgi:quinol monooxygenase YgiN
MSELQVIARYTMTAGHEDEVVALVSKLAEAGRREPGNVSFEAFRGIDDPRSLVLLERYASRDAFAAHRETPHFTTLVLGQIVPLLDGRVVEAYDVKE